MAIVVSFLAGFVVEVIGVLQEMTPLMILGGAMIVVPSLFLPAIQRKEAVEDALDFAEVTRQLGFDVKTDLDIESLPFQLTAAALRPKHFYPRVGMYKDVEITGFDFFWDEENGHDQHGRPNIVTYQVTCTMASIGHSVRRTILADPAYVPAHAKIRKVGTPDAIRSDWEFRGNAEYADLMTDDETTVDFIKGLGARWYFEIAKDKMICFRTHASIESYEEVTQRMDALLGLRERLPKQPSSSPLPR